MEYVSYEGQTGVGYDVRMIVAIIVCRWLDNTTSRCATIIYNNWILNCYINIEVDPSFTGSERSQYCL